MPWCTTFKTQDLFDYDSGGCHDWRGSIPGLSRIRASRMSLHDVRVWNALASCFWFLHFVLRSFSHIEHLIPKPWAQNEFIRDYQLWNKLRTDLLMDDSHPIVVRENTKRQKRRETQCKQCLICMSRFQHVSTFQMQNCSVWHPGWLLRKVNKSAKWIKRHRKWAREHGAPWHPPVSQCCNFFQAIKKIRK